MGGNTLHLESPWVFIAALLLLAAVIAIARVRRIRLPRGAQTSIVIGLLLICLSAGGLTWRRQVVRPVQVMVDLSPSTRSAEYRDRAYLERRIGELLGDTPYRIITFADRNIDALPDGRELPDVPCERTVFSPPGQQPVVLFSDGQFELPGVVPPTYAVIDIGLTSPEDAAVRWLQAHRQRVTVDVSNSDGSRQLALSGVDGPAVIRIPPHSLVHNATPDPEATGVVARLNEGDDWPENDALSAPVSPPVHDQRWWVGARGAGEPWRAMAPEQLPVESAEYVAASVIVLEDVDPSSLSAIQQQRLEQYVRDLGGSLLIVGGERAFTGEADHAIERLSPLASVPPSPTMHWMLLVDASGSMNQRLAPDGATGDAITLWQSASGALVRLLPALPPEDLVSIGGFSAGVDWWMRDRPAREAAGAALPPAQVRPSGPTNLEPALRQVAETVRGDAETTVVRPLLVMTDAEARIEDVEWLIDAYQRRRISLHVLAIGEGQALPALERIAEQTGGSVHQQLDPRRWAEAMRQVMRGALPHRLHRTPIDVQFTGDLADLGMRRAEVWNRTWLKEQATALATGRFEGDELVLAGHWHRGTGQVISIAYSMDASDIALVADRLARPPRDPRFAITWEAGEVLAVSVDAADGDGYLNGLSLQLRIDDADGQAETQEHAIPQTAPGRYELSLAALRRPGFASLYHGQRLLDRLAVAGRYAPEFDAIGINLSTLRELTSRSGGRIVEPSQMTAIRFPWPRRSVSMGPLLSVLGALGIAIGLVWWRVTA